MMSIKFNVYLKFLFCLFKPLGVSGVNHIDEYVRVVKVVPPVWSDLPLSPDVPDVELEPLALYGLNVEPLGGGDGGDVFTGEALQDGRLSCIVQTKQQYPQFSVWR